MGRPCRKSDCLPELEQGDVLQIEGKPNVFELNLKSAPAFMMSGELDIHAAHRDVATLAEALAHGVFDKDQLKGTPFEAIEIKANPSWQDPLERVDLSNRLAVCIREALKESIVLSLKRVKDLPSRITQDFTCLFLLYAEENGLLNAPEDARAQIVEMYVTEFARACKMDMDLHRLIRKRDYTKVWRQSVFPIYAQARRDFRMLRKERNRLKKRSNHTNFRATWAVIENGYAHYGSLLDRVATSSPTDLALEYVQEFFKCDAELDAIYEQMKTAEREWGEAHASPVRVAISEGLDRVISEFRVQDLPL